MQTFMHGYPVTIAAVSNTAGQACISFKVKKVPQFSIG